MSSFDLLSSTTKKQVAQKSLLKISVAWIAIWGILFFVVLISVVTFFINLYYSVQLNDRGNTIIGLIANQNKYTDTITTIENYNARKDSLSIITQKRLLVDQVINKIDILAKNTVTSYDIDKETGKILLTGKIGNPNDIVDITKEIRKDDSYTTLQINSLSKNGDIYTYDISFNLNSEKL